jgi:hypothetical protein
MENTASEARPRIKNTLASMQSLLAQIPDESYSYQTNLLHLLNRLEQFGDSQLDYFDTNVPHTSPFYDYPIGVIISQISHDLEVIERVSMQRSARATAFQDTLALADQLCYRALEPVHTLLEPGFTVLTYLQKMPAVRVIPYAPVALIGIPYTTLNSDPKGLAQRSLESESSAALDFLAIPHEAGHYVFWHAYVPGSTGPDDTARKPFPVVLLERLKDKPFKGSLDVRRWLDEIFADVYGCLVAGPVMAIDFQDMALNRSLSEFTEDDGEHPIPLLRPEVYRIALEKMGFVEQLPLQEYAEAVNARWLKKISNRPYFPRSVDGDALVPVNQVDVLADLEIIIEEIVRVLCEPGLGQWNDAQTGNRRWWLSDEPLPALRNTGIQTLLYQDFLKRISEYSETIEIPVIPPAKSEENWAAQFIRDAEQARNAGMEFKPLLSGLTPDQVAVLWGRGWATDGPVGYWP